MNPAPASPVEADAGLRERLASPLVLLNLLGVVLVGLALVGTRPAVAVPGWIAVATWTAWALLPWGPVRYALLLGCALAAAVGAGLGGGALSAPVIAALVVGVSRAPARTAVVLVVVPAVALAVTATVHGVDLGDLLTLLAAVGFGGLGGFLRRQRRESEAQAQALQEQARAAEREAERAHLLEARSAAARDVHDVLAHSLGGLVLQLDAIEALLERGRTAEAATRAADARRLAGEGLSEARRAVAVLRDPDAATAPPPDGALSDLLAEHRALGGTVAVEGDPALAGVDPAHRVALVRALQEALANARRHAPGGLVTVAVRREPTALVLRVANPLPAAVPASPGGGHGLVGMRERFAALGDGSIATAGVEGDRFVVEARAVLS